jgi:hypothetical protein
MNNLFVISYDASYEAPYGVARFADINGPHSNPFSYFPTHEEALAVIEVNGGLVFHDESAEAV